MGDKKQLVKSMSASENFLMVLMPVSVTASAYLVAKANDDSIHSTIAAIAGFYFGWVMPASD